MIHILSSNAFSGVLSAPKVTGINPLFRAKIRVDDESVRCYVKPVPDMIECPTSRRQVANQEVVSEALGYVLAKSCDLSVPDKAGIILLDQAQIPEPTLDALSALSGGRLQDNYFCWFTKDMDCPNLTQRHLQGVTLDFLLQRRLRRLVKALVDAPETPRVIAFDDWLMNSDRHPGNLLTDGGGLILIDHGRILVYPNWFPGAVGSLGPGAKLTNRLRNLIDTHEPNWSEKLPKKSEMLMAYNTFAGCFRDRGEDAARAVLAEFFDVLGIEATINVLKRRPDPMAYAAASGMVL